MKPSLIALGLLAMLAGCKARESEPSQPATPTVTDAVVRLAAVEGRPAAAYFTLHGGKAADRLTGVASPRVQKIELHESMMDDGMMTMKPLAGVDLPASGEVAFKPGGGHAMLFGVDPAVKPGTTIALTFTFRSGATRAEDAKVVAAGDDMPMEHMSH